MAFGTVFAFVVEVCLSSPASEIVPSESITASLPELNNSLIFWISGSTDTIAFGITPFFVVSVGAAEFDVSDASVILWFS